MKKYWKQFVGLGTAFARSPLDVFALKLAILYIVTILAVIYVVPFIATSAPGVNTTGLVVVVGVVGFAASMGIIGSFRKTIAVHKRYISDIAHDVRNCIAIIKMTSEIALMQGADAPGGEYRETVEGTLTEVEKMQGIIDRLGGHVFAAPRPVRANRGSTERAA